VGTGKNGKKKAAGKNLKENVQAGCESPSESVPETQRPMKPKVTKEERLNRKINFVKRSREQRAI